MDEELEFVMGLIKRHHFTDEEKFKMINIFQRYLLLRDSRQRKRYKHT